MTFVSLITAKRAVLSCTSSITASGILLPTLTFSTYGSCVMILPATVALLSVSRLSPTSMPDACTTCSAEYRLLPCTSTRLTLKKTATPNTTAATSASMMTSRPATLFTGTRRPACRRAARRDSVLRFGCAICRFSLVAKLIRYYTSFHRGFPHILCRRPEFAAFPPDYHTHAGCALLPRSATRRAHSAPR